MTMRRWKELFHRCARVRWCGPLDLRGLLTRKKVVRMLQSAREGAWGGCNVAAVCVPGRGWLDSNGASCVAGTSTSDEPGWDVDEVLVGWVPDRLAGPALGLKAGLPWLARPASARAQNAEKWKVWTHVDGTLRQISLFNSSFSFVQTMQVNVP